MANLIYNQLYLNIVLKRNKKKEMRLGTAHLKKIENNKI